MERTSTLLELPSDAVENIRKMYDIDRPERLKATLDLLEDWMRKQSHFLKRDFSREYLEKTLITCKGSVEKAKKQLDSICTVKTVLPKFFTKTNAREELHNLIEVAWLLPLPKLMGDYCRIILLRINAKAIQPQHFLEYYQNNVINCEYIKRHDYVNGFVVVIDFRNVNMMDFVAKMNPVELQQIVTILTEAYGSRLRNLYFLSESKTIELLVKLLKQFLSEKISSGIRVVANLEELHKFVPKELLPKDYGGNEKPSDVLMKQWVDEISTKEHVEYMKMMNKAGTDESLRPATMFNEDYMGMPGSFRHLSVD